MGVVAIGYTLHVYYALPCVCFCLLIHSPPLSFLFLTLLSLILSLPSPRLSSCPLPLFPSSPPPLPTARCSCKVQRTSGGLEITSTRTKASVTFEPFQVDFYINNEIAVVLNSRGLMNFEHYRNKRFACNETTGAATDTQIHTHTHTHT